MLSVTKKVLSKHLQAVKRLQALSVGRQGIYKKEAEPGGQSRQNGGKK